MGEVHASEKLVLYSMSDIFHHRLRGLEVHSGQAISSASGLGLGPFFRSCFFFPSSFSLGNPRLRFISKRQKHGPDCLFPKINRYFPLKNHLFLRKIRFSYQKSALLRRSECAAPYLTLTAWSFSFYAGFCNL